MTVNRYILAAAIGSLALLLGAWGFQALGYAPCKMCVWQRWPHAAAVAIGIVAIIVPARVWPILGGLAALTTAGIGAYHTGVERGWWQGPTTCTSGDVSDLSTDELLNQILTAPLVRCDEVAWSLLGLSMASWNMILSLGLVALWIMAARRA